MDIGFTAFRFVTFDEPAWVIFDAQDHADVIKVIQHDLHGSNRFQEVDEIFKFWELRAFTDVSERLGCSHWVIIFQFPFSNEQQNAVVRALEDGAPEDLMRMARRYNREARNKMG